jgi:glycine cleavage system H protein
MAEVYFTKDHEWVRIEGEIAVVGITDYAQERLGDVVFVEMPEIGTSVTQGEQCSVVDSVKAASEVYAPISGEIAAVNDTLTDDPARVNADPLGDGWFFKIKFSNASEFEELMDKKAYKKLVEGLDE